MSPSSNSAAKTVVMLLDNPFTRDNRVKREALALADAGYRVTILALCPDATEGLPDVDTLVSDSGNPVEIRRCILPKWVFYHHHPMRQIRYILEAVSLWRRLLESSGKNPDLIHVNDVQLLPFGVWWKWLSGARLLYDSHEYWQAYASYSADVVMTEPDTHGTQADRERDRRHWLRLVQIEPWCLRWCDGVISVSQSICRELQVMWSQWNGSAAKRHPVICIRNMPADGLAKRETGRLRLFHERYGLSPETRVVLFQGNIEPTRGIDVMIDAAQHVMELPLVWVAMGPLPDDAYAQQLLTKAEAQLGPGRFFLKGPEYGDSFAQWTRSADIGVVTARNINRSYYYSLPNKLFEYMQAGLPLVCPDFPDMSQQVKHYHVGEVFTMEAPETLAEAIRGMVSQPDFPVEYEAGLRRAQVELTWNMEREGYLALVRSLL